MVRQFEGWVAEHDRHQAPTMVLIGSSVHHMFQLHENNLRHYEEQLRKLKPTAHRLAEAGTPVIWCSQNEIIDLYVSTGAFGSGISSDKVRRYDQAARRIFRDSTVLVWDSIRPLADEYVRGCRHHPNRNDRLGHHDCGDFVHTGKVAIDEGIQYLLNFFCTK